MPIDRFSSDDQMTTIIADADYDQTDQRLSFHAVSLPNSNDDTAPPVADVMPVREPVLLAVLMRLANRFDKAGGDKIKLVATGGAPAFNGVIHFDSNADWNGDGTKDTILHVNGRALAIIHGQSIDSWVTSDFEDGTVTSVSELDFTVLPDIS